jgi:hypothetical protein
MATAGLTQPLLRLADVEHQHLHSGRLRDEALMDWEQVCTYFTNLYRITDMKNSGHLCKYPHSTKRALFVMDRIVTKVNCYSVPLTSRILGHHRFLDVRFVVAMVRNSALPFTRESLPLVGMLVLHDVR